jgi:mono/diheme cytochrome c family protein
MIRSTMTAAGLVAVALGLGSAASRVAAQHDPVYDVRDGKVDTQTYNGYRRYGDACLRCHGQGGNGSSFGPALIESLRRLSYEQFAEVVINGRKGRANLVMPAFGEVEDVAIYLDDIYGYLKARSDGKITAARPQKF